MIYQYKTSQILPIGIEQAWEFFSSPKNLSKITPPEMDFKILNDSLEDDIYTGMQIDYKVKPLLGIPVHWKTEIVKVIKYKEFTDTQLKGPYSLWEHTHTFEKREDGVYMEDIINYRLPLGILGDIAHSLFVKNKIVQIFDHRKKVLEKIFH